MNPHHSVSLAVLAALSALPGLRAATDAVLVEMLVANGALTTEQAAGLEVSTNVPTDPALIAALVSNGSLTTEQANRLQRATVTVATATATPAPAPAPAAPSSEAPAYVVKPKDKAIQTLTISGRLQAQMDYLNTDYDSATDPDEEFNLFFRRVRLGADVNIADGITGSLNTDFSSGISGDGRVEKAIVAFDLDDHHSLQVGYQKVPFGYEETTSSSRIPAIERSIATRYFIEDLDYGARYTGLHLEGEQDSGLYYTLALTNSARGNVTASSPTDNLAFWGRLGLQTESGEVDFDVGLNAGQIPDQRVDGATDRIWGLYANAAFDAFTVQFEYLSGSLEDAKGTSDASPTAYHLTGIWKATPTFEAVARAALFDADGGVGADISSTTRRAPEAGSARYDEVVSYYLGGNWYIRGNTVKLSAGYEWADYSENLGGTQGDATVSGARTRLQLLF